MLTPMTTVCDESATKTIDSRCEPSMKSFETSCFTSELNEVDSQQTNSLMSLTTMETNSTPSSPFQKYKTGTAHKNAPFKLVQKILWSTETDSDSQMDNQKKRGPYRKYTVLEKEEAVRQLNQGGDIRMISKEYEIPRRNLLRWKRNGCERKEGGGRPTDVELQQSIHHLILNLQLKDEKSIRNAAKQLSQNQSFKASKGWFVKFCTRYSINLSLNKL